MDEADLQCTVLKYSPMILFRSARFAMSNSNADNLLVRIVGMTGLCALESLSPTTGDSVRLVRLSSTSSVDPSRC